MMFLKGGVLMRITDIRIENFRSIEAMEIVFPSNLPVTILPSEKYPYQTEDVLRAMAFGLKTFLAPFETAGRKWEKEDVRISNEFFHSAYIEMETKTSDGKILNWTQETGISKNEENTQNDFKEVYAYTNALKTQVQQGESIELPFVAYYSHEKRRIFKKEVTNKKFEQKNFSRLDGYKTLLSEKMDEKELLQWFWQEQLLSVQQKKTTVALKTVSKTITKFFHLVNPAVKKVSIVFDLVKMDICPIVTMEQKDVVSLREMPQGNIKDAWILLLNILYHMILLNPQLEKKVAKKTHGILLLEESFSKTYLEAFHKIFPNLQIICC